MLTPKQPVINAVLITYIDYSIKTIESCGDGLLEAGVWRVKDRTCAERRDKKIAEKKGYHGHN